MSVHPVRNQHVSHEAPLAIKKSQTETSRATALIFNKSFCHINTLESFPCRELMTNFGQNFDSPGQRQNTLQTRQQTSKPEGGGSRLLQSVRETGRLSACRSRSLHVAGEAALTGEMWDRVATGSRSSAFMSTSQ